MDSRTKKVLGEFWLLIAVGVSILLAFFVYGNVFEIWEKKFADTPRLVNYGFYGFIALALFYLFVFYRFVGKHEDILLVHKPKPKKRN